MFVCHFSVLYIHIVLIILLSQFRNAGHFWAQPVLTPELASIVEDLNDHFQFGPGAQAPAAVPRKGMVRVQGVQ